MKALFPYRTLFGDVTGSVDSVYIDDVEISGRVDIDGRRVSLVGIERKDWTTASLTVVISGPAGELADAESVVATAIANCGRTNNRASTILTEDPNVAGRWVGTLRLDREYWFGQAELRLGVAATVEGVDNRVIGWSDPWTLDFDDLPNQPVVGGAIKITWVDFGNPEDGRLYLRDHSDKYVYLSLDPNEPHLFLNRGFDGLEALLADRRGRRGADRALHDQTRASIADKVWSALFNAALDSITTDDDDHPEMPEIEWQKTVLLLMLEKMFPGQSPEAALEDAYSALHTPDSAGSLQERLAPAASDQARAPRLLRDGIRLLSHELMSSDDEEG